MRLVSASGRRLAYGTRPDGDGSGGIGVHLRFLRVQAAMVHWVGYPRALTLQESPRRVLSIAGRGGTCPRRLFHVRAFRAIGRECQSSHSRPTLIAASMQGSHYE